MKSFVRRYAPSAMAYFLVGGSCALIEWGSFWILTRHVDLHYMGAAGLSFFLATFVNWLLSSRLVFQSAGRSTHAEILLVYAVSAVGFAVNLSVMTAAIELMAVPEMPAKIMGTGVAFVVNYLARQFFVFDRQVHRLIRPEEITSPP
jgi:putative flippase GtrA